MTHTSLCRIPICHANQRQASVVRHMRLCAGLLGDQGCETLEAGLHRSLLCHLCDEALDREPLRVLLTRRMDWAENVRKDMRDAAAEDKGRIKASPASLSNALLTLYAGGFLQAG